MKYDPECNCENACTHLSPQTDPDGHRLTWLGLRNIRARHGGCAPWEPGYDAASDPGVAR